MKYSTIAMLALLATGAQAAPKAAEVQAMMKGSFTDKGIAKAERVEQDALQAACSATKPPTTEQAAKLQAEQLASVKWPSDGKYLGDWKEGEKLAQNGKGMTWSDKADAPSGGNCYNCHQISKKEISFGTIGPSLYQYGKLRGVADPAAAASEAVVKYTWGKIYNAKAYNACSGMPRFGHAGVLTEGQMRDIMALLLDPKSPVNE